MLLPSQFHKITMVKEKVALVTSSIETYPLSSMKGVSKSKTVEYSSLPLN